jgi:hypothetical protein
MSRTPPRHKRRVYRGRPGREPTPAEIQSARERVSAALIPDFEAFRAKRPDERETEVAIAINGLIHATVDLLIDCFPEPERVLDEAIIRTLRSALREAVEEMRAWNQQGGTA